MTKEMLLQAINAHEDNFIERKPESVSPSELRQTASAFANSVPEGREAILFIGVHDKTGEPLGISDTDQLQKRVREALQRDCYPPIEYRSEVLTLQDKTVLAVVIPFSRTKPHFTGPAFIRVGSESKKASPELYEELILSRNDKCREILRHKDEVFTVLGVGHKVGSNKRLNDSNYREGRECRIVSCSAHLLRLHDIALRVNLSEPLENVSVSHDEERHRPMLIVTFR